MPSTGVHLKSLAAKKSYDQHSYYLTSPEVVMKTLAFTYLFFAISSFWSASGEAQTLTQQKQALQVISEFANNLCDQVATKGTAESGELSGEAKAELNGVLSTVTNLGIKGAGKWKGEEYQGLLRQDLAKAVADASNCKLAVFKDLKDKLIPVAAHEAPKPKIPEEYFAWEVCNDSGYAASIAVVSHTFPGSPEYKVSGWYQVLPSECRIFKLVRGSFYWYANGDKHYWSGDTGIRVCVGTEKLGDRPLDSPPCRPGERETMFRVGQLTNRTVLTRENATGVLIRTR